MDLKSGKEGVKGAGIQSLEKDCAC